MTRVSTSQSPANDAVQTAEGWPALPTETEIYILPDGRVVIADLPAELQPLVAQLGVPEACEVTLNDQPDSAV